MSFMKDEQRDIRSQGIYYSSGLRDYLIKVYNYMAIALALTGVVAFLVSSSETAMAIVHNSPLRLLIVFAPVAMVLFMSYKLQTLTLQSVLLIFFGFSALMGLSISYVFFIYTSESIARVFFISSSMFGSMAWYGNVSKSDLSKFSSFLYMGLIGIIVSSIINIFLGSGALQFAICFISVILFTVMTAFDAQRIKDLYYRLNVSSDSEEMNKIAILGSTTMYFNYINIFLNLLHIMGHRK